jgi:hypothetical protein
MLGLDRKVVSKLRLNKTLGLHVSHASLYLCMAQAENKFFQILIEKEEKKRKCQQLEI